MRVLRGARQRHALDVTERGGLLADSRRSNGAWLTGEVELALNAENIESTGGSAAIRDLVHPLDVHWIVVGARPYRRDTHRRHDPDRQGGGRVSVLPRMFDIVGSAVEFDDLDGMTMLGIRRFMAPPLPDVSHARPIGSAVPT